MILEWKTRRINYLYNRFGGIALNLERSYYTSFCAVSPEHIHVHAQTQNTFAGVDVCVLKNVASEIGVANEWNLHKVNRLFSNSQCRILLT